MITAICGHEYNAGRTTIATNLAAMLAQAGKDVLLIDASPNKEATAFTQRRSDDGKLDPGYTCVAATTSSFLTMILERLAPRFNEIIIDIGGDGTAYTALAACHACLVVASPQWKAKHLDEQLLDSVRGINPTFVAHLIFNRRYVGFNKTECEADLSAAAWEGGGTFTFSNRKSFAESWSFAVTEADSKDRVAMKETTALFECLYGKFEPKPKIEKRIREGFFSFITHAYAIELPAALPQTQAGKTDVQ